MKPARGKQRGFTLIEVAVVLAVSAVILVPLASIVAGQIRIPVKIQSELKASQQVQKATLTITEDANTAQSFTSGTNPDYGTFKWFEFSGAAPIAVQARYYWSDGQLFREFTRGGEVASPRSVLSGISQFSDIAFTHTAPAWAFDPATKLWNYTEGKVTTSITTTHEAGAEFASTIFTAQLVSDFRPEADRPVPLPGRLAPPAPPPNQVNFRIAGDPTLITGTFRSGSGSDLRYDDTNYYVTRGAGTPRVIVWEATSEAIDYTTISSISVELTGQADKSGVVVEMFVHNPNDAAHTDGGYDPVADAAVTYTAANTDSTLVISFSSADVSYVNSLATKIVKIKVKATLSTVFDLSADKLVFKVAGTPSATFSRDYFLETDPTIEVGSFVGGTFVSLGTDDTSYYTVQRSGSTVQWVAVSEPIALDTMSSVEVKFIVRSSQSNVTLAIYVFNPANGGDGYPATPNSETTIASSNTDTPVSFFLSAADVDYAESLFPKEARIRVKATGTTGVWQLEGDQLFFRVKP